MSHKFNQLTFVDNNRLQVDDNFLWADVLPMPSRYYGQAYETISAEQLQYVLAMGRTAIITAIEEFYLRQYAELTPRGYTVVRPSVWVAQLGSTEQTDGIDSQVYSAKGYKNGGVHYSIDEQQEIFWPHWKAVERAGFVPHVRGSQSGAWLMLRNDSEQ